jgi:hypothetical protein
MISQPFEGRQFNNQLDHKLLESYLTQPITYIDERELVPDVNGLTNLTLHEPLYFNRLKDEAFYRTEPETTFSLRFGYSEEYNALVGAIEQGNPYSMENGFTFVVDHRPEGHEGDFISAEEYTQYFANRRIPITAEGMLHSHDLGHARDYLRIFKDPLFADVVAGAAANSLGDPEECRKFTSATDKFGDAIFIMGLTGLVGDGTVNGVSMARHHLRRLVSLFTGEPFKLDIFVDALNKDPTKSDFIVNAIWEGLGLPSYVRPKAQMFLPLPVRIDLSSEEPVDSLRERELLGYFSRPSRLIRNKRTDRLKKYIISE